MATGLSPAWRTSIRNKLSQTLSAALGNLPGQRRMRVSKVWDETENIRSIHLVPTDGEALPRHLAGQFLPVTLQDKVGMPVRRSYSISSAPGADALRLTVRLERNPDGSPGSGSGLIHALVPGDTILANPPAGSFHPDPEDDCGLLLVGAGIGITPLVAIASDALSRGRRARMAISRKNRSDLALGDDLAALQSRYPEFRLDVIHTRGNGGEPRLTANSLGALEDGDEVYLCGPDGFVSDLRAQFQNRGVPAWRILSETFKLASTGMPIQTQACEVQFSELGGPVVNRGETLLETAEAQGLLPPSGCRAGSCELCVTHLVSGKVRYVEPVERTDDKLVHLCVAAPDGPVRLGPLGMGHGVQIMPEWMEDQLGGLFERDD